MKKFSIMTIVYFLALAIILLIALLVEKETIDKIMYVLGFLFIASVADNVSKRLTE